MAARKKKAVAEEAAAAAAAAAPKAAKPLEREEQPTRVIESLLGARGDEEGELDDMHISRLLYLLRAQGGTFGGQLAAKLEEPA